MALRAEAPTAQAPARPRAGGGAIILRTPSTQSAGPAAPIVAALPPGRPATAPAAPGPHPFKKSPTEACEDARPFHYDTVM
jgi:hypothetical protein